MNGDDYLAIPFEEDSVEENSGMEIGYITRQNTILSSIGKLYIDEIRKYLGIGRAIDSAYSSLYFTRISAEKEDMIVLVT